MPSDPSPFSRRSFLQFSAAAAAFHIVTEPMLAAAARRPVSKDGVMIDSNENPLGPGQAAREAISAIIPQGGRYLDNLTDDLIHTFAQQETSTPSGSARFPVPAHPCALESSLSLHRRKVTSPPIPATKQECLQQRPHKPASSKFHSPRLTRTT